MSSTPKPSSEVVFQELEDEAVLVHLRTNRIYSLNGTGARFWVLLNSGHELPTIREKIMREFAVDADRLDAEIARLLDELAREGLVFVPDA